MKSQGGDYVYGQAYVRGGDCHRNWKGKLKCNPRIYRDLHAANIYGIAGLEASVLSGGGINIVSNNLLNDASLIISSSNFEINTAIFNNNSYTFVQYDDATRNYEYYTSLIKSGGSLTITQNGATNPSLINGNNIAQYVAIARNSKQLQNTAINKVDVYTLAQTGILAVDLTSIINAINNSNIDKNIANNQASSGIELAKTDITASISPTSGSTSPNTNFIFSGNFKINLDPAKTTPLVESRSQFTDISKFFGSSYYFNQLGLNGSSVLADIDRQARVNNTRMLGDSAVETKLIIDQLKKLTNDSLFLSKDVTDANQQIKELLDNSISQFATLGLDAKDVAINGLTKDQVNSLTKDIVTFEVTNVNGISVLAPKIYLSQDTRNRLFNSNSKTNGKALANSSTIFAKENLTIDSPTAFLTNNGSITSGGNLNLNLASLTNKTNSIAQAQIIANNNLSITAQNGDIKNIGAKIGAIGSVNLEALN
jgi:filamentous hemagglutinin